MMKGFLSGWTFRRVLYLGLGTLLIVQSIVNSMWIGVLFGAYFAAMGLFAFGCAGGQCAVQEPRHTSVEKMVPDPVEGNKKTIQEGNRDRII